jgi:VanZ family protein
LRTFIPALIWGAIILVLSLTPASNLPISIKDLLSFDKVAHAGAYFVLTGLLLWGFYRQGRLTRRRGWLVVLLSSLYGILMEIAQYAFFPDRYFELFDIIANIIGSVMGLFILKFFLK